MIYCLEVISKEVFFSIQNPKGGTFMTMSSNNPKMEAIRQSVGSSYNDLNQLIDGPLATIDPSLLYQSPGQNEWTLMENIAHIIEFMPYWGDEIAKLLANPGQNFGRTPQHEGRLRAIEEYGHDTLEQARATLPASYAHLNAVLSRMQDSDLEVVGHHPRFGDRSLGWFIKVSVTDHLASHVEQMKACLAALQR